MAISDVTRGLAPWAYEGGPRALVLALKLRGLKDAATPLVDAMVRCARLAGLDPDLVTWVPARGRDKAARGFDHAEVLATGVAQRLGVPAAGVLARRGSQLDQVGLDRTGRLRNLARAFAATTGVPRVVLLVDDVVTTGATAASCAAALKTGGAERVDVLAGCRR
jgi:predicted amidophosphoribosyltransferase